MIRGFRHLSDLLYQFTDGKRLALDLVVANRIDQISAANQHPQLAHIQFGNEYLFVSG